MGYHLRETKKRLSRRHPSRVLSGSGARLRLNIDFMFFPAKAAFADQIPDFGATRNPAFDQLAFAACRAICLPFMHPDYTTTTGSVQSFSPLFSSAVQTLILVARLIFPRLCGGITGRLLLLWQEIPGNHTLSVSIRVDLMILCVVHRAGRSA